MNFKLDENLGPAIVNLFLKRQLDAQTVVDERLGGAPDQDVLAAANFEGRVFVTMDMDFSNVVLYPPDKSVGIIVLRPHGRATPSMLSVLVTGFLDKLDEFRAGKLWIVEPGRIREHEDDRFP